MKDMLIDLYYNWRHSMSKENTKGTRMTCIVVFVSCLACVVGGLAGVIASLIAKLWLGAVTSLFFVIFGTGLFTWMSRQ